MTDWDEPPGGGEMMGRPPEQGKRKAVAEYVEKVRRNALATQRAQAQRWSIEVYDAIDGEWGVFVKNGGLHVAGVINHMSAEEMGEYVCGLLAMAEEMKAEGGAE